MSLESISPLESAFLSIRIDFKKQRIQEVRTATSKWILAAEKTRIFRAFSWLFAASILI